MEIAVAVLLLLVFYNALASHHVLKYGEELGWRKTLFLIGIWIIPLMGAWAAFDLVRAPGETGKSLQAVPQRRARELQLPLTLAGGGQGDFDLAAHISKPQGFPLLDWPALQAWAEANFSGEQQAQAIAEGRRAWLLHLGTALAGDMHLHESPEALILSSLELHVAKAMAEYVATTQRRIRRVLQDVAQFPAQQKTLVVIFDSEQDYYDYVALYYPDGGEYATSSGMFIHAGCPHFVAVRADLTAIEPVIAHEMTHLALAHLDLPRWLNEGIAVNTELRLSPSRRSHYTPRELHQKHLAFWNESTIQEFWSGQSFFRSDDGNLLSYELARIIVEHLAKHWPSFAAFIHTAHAADAGDAAAKAALGIDLGDWIVALLEAPPASDWSAKPALWAVAEGNSEAAPVSACFS